jgi:glycosyltransferase involved in cell wall biosynthesis
MKLILNVDALTPPLTGIGHYTLRLARGLRNHPAISELRYFAGWRWVSDPEAASVATRPIAVARRWVPFKPAAAIAYGWLQQYLFRRQTGRLSDFLVHAPNYILPPWAGPSVATLHDLSHLHYPQHHPRERIRYLERYLPPTLDRASRLIAVSEFVRQEIHQHLSVPLARIVTVHNGVDAAFHPRPAHDTAPVLARHGLEPGGYLLSVATLEPRKNLIRLAQAHSRLPVGLCAMKPLVLIGASGWLTEELERYLEPLERADHVRRLGYVPQTDLPLLYAGAFAFAYPSLYEGFGLPVLEAMASGVPVLTSDRSSLPEVVGEAAILVNPEDVEAITAGLERVLTDTDWRFVAIQRGLQQAQCFSWERCIEETVAVYQQALVA